MTTISERFDSVARAAALVAMLFAWTLCVMSVLSSVVPSNSRTSQLLRMTIQQVVAVGGMAAAVAWVRRHRPRRISNAPAWWWIGPALTVFAAFCLVPITNAWSTSILDLSPPDWWQQVVDLSSVWAAVTTLAVLAVVPPVCEECFFRGVLLDELQEVGGIGAVSLQAAAFALYHLDLYGLPSYIALGFLFGWLRLRFGLRAAIGAHVVNNALAVAWLDGWFTSVSSRMTPVFSICAAMLVAGIYASEMVVRKKRVGHR